MLYLKELIALINEKKIVEESDKVTFLKLSFKYKEFGRIILKIFSESTI
jgi:hypothetical protein